MPPGTVTDPDNNPRESQFGYLLSYEDDHIKPYLKDDNSRFYPAQTPVTFETKTITFNFNDEPVKIEIAYDVRFDPSRGNRPMTDQYIELAQVKLKDRELGTTTYDEAEIKKKGKPNPST